MLLMTVIFVYFFLLPLFPKLQKLHCETDVFVPQFKSFTNRLYFRERNCLLKEAEVLHKARFNHIIQILGICNEPEFFCIVTEYMSNGSLDLLLHQVAS